MGLTVDSSQLTFLPSSKSCDTKTRTNIKNLVRSNLDIVPQFKNQWSVASSHYKCQETAFENGRISNFVRARDLDLGSGHNVYRQSSLIDRPLPMCQMSLKSKKLFVERRTHTRMDGHLRPTLLGRFRRVDLIKKPVKLLPVAKIDHVKTEKLVPEHSQGKALT